MKFNLLTCVFAIMSIVSSAYADEFILPQSDYIGMDTFLGQKCSTMEKIVIKCECLSPQINISETCYVQGYISGSGCMFETSEDAESRYYCVDAEANQTCHICRCNNNQTYTAWAADSGNRVKRTKYSTQDVDSYTCTSAESTEYGCAAGYYQSGGSGSAMTCTRCPSSGGVYGTNAAGTTDITSCYIPSNTQMNETSGKSVFTSNCYYTK